MFYLKNQKNQEITTRGSKVFLCKFVIALSLNDFLEHLGACSGREIDSLEEGRGTVEFLSVHQNGWGFGRTHDSEKQYGVVAEKGFLLKEHEIKELLGSERINGGHENLGELDVTLGLPLFRIAEFPVEVVRADVVIEDGFAFFTGLLWQIALLCPQVIVEDCSVSGFVETSDGPGEGVNHESL